MIRTPIDPEETSQWSLGGQYIWQQLLGPIRLERCPLCMSICGAHDRSSDGIHHMTVVTPAVTPSITCKRST